MKSIIKQTTSSLTLNIRKRSVKNKLKMVQFALYFVEVVCNLKTVGLTSLLKLFHAIPSWLPKV